MGWKRKGKGRGGEKGDKKLWRERRETREGVEKKVVYRRGKVVQRKRVR